MTGQNPSMKMSRQELRKLADFREMAEAHIERLGHAIKARRLDLGWSRARLGREVDAAEKTVERWEKAQTAGALDNIEAIARALDMDGDELLVKAMPPRKPGPTPDPFASGSELSELLNEVQEVRSELESARLELLGEIGEVRTSQEALQRSLRRDERDEEAEES